MIDLSNIDLTALVERDGATLRGGAEKVGPCPQCGGHDRFHVRSYQDRGYFFCRQCHDKRGDAIEYLRWLHGMTYVEALAALGLQGDRPTLPTRRTPKPKPMTATGVAIPEALDDPPTQDWQQVARALVDECAARLWTPTGAAALAYLRGERRLNDDTIRLFKLGWNLTDDKQRGAWRGITLPLFYGGDLWAVNIRRPKANVARWGDKYMMIRGSKRGQLFNGDALFADGIHTAIICGGEFDVMAAQQHAPAGVAVVTFGSETKRVTWEADYLLRGKRVLISYDNDQAGDTGAAQWVRHGERVRVPSGKDVTEYAQGGGDVAAWLASMTDVPDYSSELETAILKWLESKGYTPTFNEQGHIVANQI